MPFNRLFVFMLIVSRLSHWLACLTAEYHHEVGRHNYTFPVLMQILRTKRNVSVSLKSVAETLQAPGVR